MKAKSSDLALIDAVVDGEKCQMNRTIAENVDGHEITYVVNIKWRMEKKKCIEIYLLNTAGLSEKVPFKGNNKNKNLKVIISSANAWLQKRRHF